MSVGNVTGGIWAILRIVWRGDAGLPLDEHIRADAGLPPAGSAFACRPTSPFVGAWLR